MRRSLHVGLTEVDPLAYRGWNGKNGCEGCERDVANMASLVAWERFDEIVMVRTKLATRAEILGRLQQAAAMTRPGDLFAFTISGHGGQEPDAKGKESDGLNETFCAFDGHIVDDEFGEAFLGFPEGSFIFMIADCCHSGSNAKELEKVKPLTFVTQETRQQIKAKLIHIGACRDSQTTDGFTDGGRFTTQILKTWNGGKFQGSYLKFADTLTRELKGKQDVILNAFVPLGDAFPECRPFTADPPKPQV